MTLHPPYGYAPIRPSEWVPPTVALAPLLKALRITDVDLVAITNQDLRSFAQAVVCSVSERQEDSGFWQRSYTRSSAGLAQYHCPGCCSPSCHARAVARQANHERAAR